MRDPDLHDYVFALRQIELIVARLGSDARRAERDGGDMRAVAHHQLPDLRPLRDDLSVIIEYLQSLI